MRKLTLKRETVSELRDAELDSIVGAAQDITKNGLCFNSDFAPCYPTYRCTLEDCVATVRNC
jgi:hypothetical protein